MALHDSGCAVSIMNTKTFMQLKDNEKTEMIPQNEPIYISSCTGTKTPCRGVAYLFLQLLGVNDTLMTVKHKVIIHDTLDYEFLLGYDFTGSQYKVYETNTHIVFTSNPTARGYEPESLNDQNNRDFCKVPIIRSSQKLYTVNVANDVTIPPFTLVNINCAIDMKDRKNIGIVGKGQVFYEIVNLAHQNLITVPALLAYTKVTDLTFPVYNDTNNDMNLSKNTYIGHITHHDTNVPIIPVKVTSMNAKIFEINSSKPSFIADDENLSEEEKTEAFVDFITTGKYQPPMSKVIEDANSITELELKNITPFLDKDFDKQFDFKHLPNIHRKKTLKLMKKHDKVFSRHEYDIGLAKDIEMDIEVDTSKPRIQKYIPLPHAARGQITRILDQFQKVGIIRECQEPSLFCSNLLVTPKKDKKTLRILFDGRLLNSATTRYPMCLVTQMEILTHLESKDYISTFDVAQAFYQIALAPNAQAYTVFYSVQHGKRFCFNRCPQGLKNSPLYLKLLMDKLFGDLADVVIHYADDVMVSTKGTFEEHLAVIDVILQRFHDANIKISPKKIKIAQEEVEFLGTIYKKGMLKIPQAKIAAFSNYPQPKTPKQCKSFVCAMSYYRKFIPKFAEISKPIMDLSTLHPKQFKWDSTHTVAFNKMIKELVNNTSLYVPKPEQTFYVQTDASDVAGAGRVYQKDEEGKEQLISCISRTFTKTERSYGAFRKEVLALLYTLKSMDFFLRYAPNLVILIDAKAIINLRMCKDSAGILLRFSLELSKYNAEIHHVPGPENTISDILSRNTLGISDIIAHKKSVNYLTEKESEHILNRLVLPEGQRFTKDELATLLEMESLESPVTKVRRKTTAKAGIRLIPNNPKTLIAKNPKMPKESFRRPGVKLPTCPCIATQQLGIQCNHTTLNYDEISVIAKAVTEGIMTIDQFIEAQNADERILSIKSRAKLPPMYQYKDDILFYATKHQLKPVLPNALLDPLINSKHYTVFGMHYSRSRIIRDIKTKYHVSNKELVAKTDRLTKNCLVCQYNITRKKDHELNPSTFKQAPRVCWAVDIMPNLPKTKHDHTAIFLAVDVFTGYIQLYPLKSRKTPELIEAIQKCILNPFGTPKILRCDNETGMANSKEFKQFFDPLNIQFVPTSPSSPWGNGHAEKCIGIIKEGARKFVMQEQELENWDQYLHFFSSAHNQSTSIYGFAPEELHFGFKNPTEIDLLQFWPETKDQEEYMQILLPIANRNRAISLARIEKENKRVTTYRNEKRHKKEFKVGELVLHKSLQLATGTGMAMKPKLLGPFSIVALEKNGASALIENMRTKKVSKAHFTNLQLLNYCPDTSRLASNFDENILKFLPSNKNSKDKYYGSQPTSSQDSQESELQQIEPSLFDEKTLRFQENTECPNCRCRESNCTCRVGFFRRRDTNSHTPTDYMASDHCFLQSENDRLHAIFLDDIFSQRTDAYNVDDWNFDNTHMKSQKPSKPKSILKVKTDEICSQIKDTVLSQTYLDPSDDEDEYVSTQDERREKLNRKLAKEAEQTEVEVDIEPTPFDFDYVDNFDDVPDYEQPDMITIEQIITPPEIDLPIESSSSFKLQMINEPDIAWTRETNPDYGRIQDPAGTDNLDLQNQIDYELANINQTPDNQAGTDNIIPVDPLIENVGEAQSYDRNTPYLQDEFNDQHQNENIIRTPEVTPLRRSERLIARNVQNQDDHVFKVPKVPELRRSERIRARSKSLN